MLTFFRRIRKGLFGSDTTSRDATPASRYLLYSIGEIALVVVGILIALQINNWNTERINQIEIHHSLEQVNENLIAQKRQIILAIRLDKGRLNAAFRVLDYMDENVTYDDSLNGSLKSITNEDRTNYMIRNGYESIKNKKLENDSLSNMLHNLYEIHLPRIEIVTSYTTDINSIFEDYMSAHFEAVDVDYLRMQSWLSNFKIDNYKDLVNYSLKEERFAGHFDYKPKNYTQLRQDEEFRHLIKKSVELRTRKMIRFKRISELIDDILLMLETELK